MVLVFDIEGNGLPPKEKSVPTSMFEMFPEIISVCWAIISNGNYVKKIRYDILKRDDVTIWDTEAQKYHRISRNTSLLSGVNPKGVLLELADDIAACDRIVCHNTTYDTRVLDSDLHRLGIHNDPFLEKDIFCTMLNSVEYCQIPNEKRWGGKYKWPKLSELYEELFDVPMENHFQGHNAQEDVMATAKCYLKLMEVLENEKA